jgi:hypothetical protein
LLQPSCAMLTSLCLVDSAPKEFGLVDRLGRLVVLVALLAAAGTEEAPAAAFLSRDLLGNAMKSDACALVAPIR